MEEEVRNEEWEKGTEHNIEEEPATPWLTLAGRFPDYKKHCDNPEFVKAINEGEAPCEVYLRFENERLVAQNELLKKEMLIRDTAIGSAKSSADESPTDPFLEGLSYMR